MNNDRKSGKLAGKVAVVTGAGSGIGAAAAKLLASEGAHTVVADLDGRAAGKVAEEIEAAGGRSWAAALDVADRKEVEKLAGEVAAQWGGIDILVNNAGMGEVGWFVEGREEAWDRIIAVNVKGALFFCQAVLPGMIERQSGKIINIASTAAKVGSGKLAIYSATKAAVSGFSKALAREVAHYNINVNDICPGPIDTPMFEQMEPMLQKIAVRETAFRRLGRPEEIAAAVLFLASDDGSYVTGHSLMVDGGQTML